MPERCGVCPACRGTCLARVAESYVARRKVETLILEEVERVVDARAAVGVVATGWARLALLVKELRALPKREG